MKKRILIVGIVLALVICIATAGCVQISIEVPQKDTQQVTQDNSIFGIWYSNAFTDKSLGTTSNILVYLDPDYTGSTIWYNSNNEKYSYSPFTFELTNPNTKTYKITYSDANLGDSNYWTFTNNNQILTDDGITLNRVDVTFVNSLIQKATTEQKHDSKSIVGNWNIMLKNDLVDINLKVSDLNNVLFELKIKDAELFNYVLYTEAFVDGDIIKYYGMLVPSKDTTYHFVSDKWFLERNGFDVIGSSNYTNPVAIVTYNADNDTTSLEMGEDIYLMSRN